MTSFRPERSPDPRLDRAARRRTARAEKSGSRPPSRPEVRLRPTSPADLLDVVPYLLGFTPEESVVLTVLRRKEVTVTARLDLPPLVAVDEVTRRLSVIADDQLAEGVVLFTFSADSTRARAVLRRCADALAPYGVVDAIHADGHRWWSEACSGACCPVDGTPYDPVAGRMAAEAVYAGLVRRASRGEIEALVRGPAPDDADDLEDLLVDAVSRWSGLARRERSRTVKRLVEDFLDAPRPLSDREVTDLAVLVTDILVRDVAWTMMSRDRVDDHLDLWQQVVDRAVGPLVAPALGLLGMAAWISGQGALMVCCIERLLLVDPHYTLGGLLSDINERGLPPSAWEEMAGPLSSTLTQ